MLRISARIEARFSILVNRHSKHPCARSLTTLGIRREDPSRIWERRVPLTPSAVYSLMSNNKGGLAVQVEACNRRCFPNHEYAEAGAQVIPSLKNEVDLVLGIKEPPVPEVLSLVDSQPPRKRSWMVFSHTHKGQEYNTPLLASFFRPERRQSLLDWELLTGKSSRGKLERVAAFGWFAGAVGAGEALSLTGLALLRRGIATPLLHLPRPYTFTSLSSFKSAIRSAGEAIRSSPSGAEGVGPIVIGLTGRGRVSDGAKDVLDELGVVWVKVEDLPHLAERPNNQIYACAASPSDYFRQKDGRSYDREIYYKQPDQYISQFHTKFAPYLTCLINGAGWQAGFPSILSNSDMAVLIATSPPRMVAVQDITADLKGNLEFVDRHTTIDRPYYEGPGGMLVSVVDILPTELAADASEHFSNAIMPYIQHIISPLTDKGQDSDIAESLQRATIVDSGELKAQHQWLQQSVDKWRKNSSPPILEGFHTPTSSWRGVEGAVRLRKPKSKAVLIKQKKRVLLLGSGLVAGPGVEVLAARQDVLLSIGSNNLAEANVLAGKYPNVEAVHLDISDDAALGQAVSASEVVISLLPAPLHPQVAKHCIAHGKHLVTASYVSPEMKALHQSALERDVVLLGECGLDPGIDSMAAMRILDRAKREGRTVLSFISWCGGLPEPAASNVPLGYKFSWSPKAVLSASQNEARFKLDGTIQTIPGEQLLARHFPKVDLWKGLALEGVANRDALPYAEKYGLGQVEGLTDLFRGTLRDRYQGFSRVMDEFRAAGLMSSSPLARAPQSWEEFVSACGEAVACDRGSMSPEAEEALAWLTSNTTDNPIPPLPQTTPIPIDLLAHLLSSKLKYLPHERDTCLLHHTFKFSHPSSPTDLQTVTACVLVYGSEKASSMAVTVGKTLAFAALRVLDGHVRGRGVVGPYEREVWEGVLESLEGVGVRVEERWG